MTPDTLRVMIGFDPRQAVAYSVLQSSILLRSTKPVAITPLIIEQLPLKREGLTPFTYTRFLVPWLCDYKGWALFLDCDIAVFDDVAKLFAMADDKYAVMVSKNPLRFEWASVMLFNCGHDANKVLTPEYVSEARSPHLIDWCKPEEIGDLPRDWNHLVGYDAANADPKLVHYTQGVPAHPEVTECEHAQKWKQEHIWLNSTLPWVQLMGKSVHATAVTDGTLIPKLAKGRKPADAPTS